MWARAWVPVVVWGGVPLAGWLWLIVGGGVARSEVHVTPSLTVSERYDDNILYSQTKTEDFAMETAPKLVVEAKGREVDLSANLMGMWTQYANHPSLSYASSAGGLVLKADGLTGRALRGWGLTVTENYTYTKDYPAFAQLGTTALASGGVQTSRVTTFANIAGATTSYTLSPRAKVLGGYTNSRLQYSGGVSTLVDSRTDAWTGGGEYAVTPTTTLLSDYLYQRFSFSGSSALETHGADVGIRQQFQEDLTAEGRVGGTYLPSSDRLTHNFNVAVTKKFPATEMSGRYLRAITNSGGLAPLVTTQDVAQLFVTHRLTPALTATLAGNYATTKAVASSTVDLKSYSVIPAVSYAITRWATAFASYSYFKQDIAGLAGFSLDRNQVTVGLTLTWQ